MDTDTAPGNDWTPRHELASRAMLAFIANAGKDPEQPSLHLPTVAASSVAMADSILAAMAAKPAPSAPTLAEFVATSGASEVLGNYEAARADLQHWQKRALAAEDELRLLRGEQILAQAVPDRRRH